MIARHAVALMIAVGILCCSVAIAFFKLVERPSNLWLRRKLLRRRAAVPVQPVISRA